MNYELQRKLLKTAEEYVRPYLPENVLLTDDGVLSYSYNLPIMSFDMDFVRKEYLYDVLRTFIVYSIKGWFSYIITLKTDLLNLIDESKEPHDYLVVLNIIWDLIRHGYFTKSQMVDMLKDSTNYRALIELIKWEDYSVFAERKERFDL